MARQKSVSGGSAAAMGPSAGGGLSRRAAWLALAAVTLFGLGLRLYRLDALPLWNDECIQLAGVQLPVGQLRARHLFGIDHMPPGSYLVQRAFWLAGGTTWWARLPGALCGAAAVPLLYWIARRRTDRLGGLMAAVLMASAFYGVYYSQELRAYTFLGLAYLVFLGGWIEILFRPPERSIPAWAWAAWTASGWLCGAFHFGILALLPALALSTVALTAPRLWRAGDPVDRRTTWRRLGAFAVCLLAVFAGVYALMRWSMGPKLEAMRHAGASSLPSWNDVAALFLRFTWGRGWRFVALAALLLAAFFPRRSRARPLAVAAAWLGALTFLLSVVLYPLFGARGVEPEMSSRYLAWLDPCVRLAAACGTWNLLQAVRSRWRPAAAAGAVAALTAVQGSLLVDYYRMDCKWNPVRAVKAWVESRPGPVLFALASPYDLHNLQRYWPANANPLIPPAGDEATMDRWVSDVLGREPEAVFQTSAYYTPRPELAARLSAVFAHTLALAPNAAARRLEALGVKPLRGVSQTLYFNEPAAAAPRSCWPAQLPGVTVRNFDGSFALWRVLAQPVAIRVPLPADLPTAALEIPVARLDALAGVRWTVSGSPGASGERRVDPSATELAAGPGAPQRARLSVGDVARLNGQIPLRMNTDALRIPLPAAGDSTVTLLPLGAPLLLGSPRMTPAAGAEAAPR